MALPACECLPGQYPNWKALGPIVAAARTWAGESPDLPCYEGRPISEQLSALYCALFAVAGGATPVPPVPDIPPFNPSVWGDALVVRVRAQDEAYSHGDPVSLATDSSGNDYDLTSAGGARPTFDIDPDAFNGKAVYRFDGGDNLQSAVFSAAAAQPFTLAGVFQLTTTGTQVVLDGGSAGRGLVYVLSNLIQLLAGSNVGATTGPVENFIHDFVAVVDGASSKLWLDGRLVLSGDAGADTFTQLTLGADYTAGTNMTGKIAEAVVWEGDIGTDGRAAWREYVIAEYATNGGYTIVDKTLSGDPVRYIIPDTRINGRVVTYYKGTGEDSTSIADSGDKAIHVLQAIARGAIVACRGDNNVQWGNNAELAANAAMMADLKSLYGATENVDFGQSAGGIPALLKCAAGYTGVTSVGFYGIYPACDLDDMQASGTLGSGVNSAYGGDYATNAVGHNPLDLSASAFSGKCMRFIASAGDTVVGKTANSDAMAALVDATATENDVVAASGNHGDASHFLPADFGDFLDRIFT